MIDAKISGILMPVSALPARDIGNFGATAYRFIDQLVASGQKRWQVLPLGPVITNDSPFYSPSAFAINPNYISLEKLEEHGLLTRSELEEYYVKFDNENPNRINYGLLWDAKMPLLDAAYKRFMAGDGSVSPEFTSFLGRQGYWIEDYAKFMAIKDAHMFYSPGTETWFDWDAEFRDKETFDYRWNEFSRIASQNDSTSDVSQWTGRKGWSNEKLYFYQHIRERMDFHRFLQFQAFGHWDALKGYANEQGVKIIGDCPIYVAPDSADVWAHRGAFKLDEKGSPKCVAGVPPDFFSPELGQFWGNPIYRWFDDDGGHNEAAFSWWSQRLMHSFRQYDEVRIDHFRGFEKYWEVPIAGHVVFDGIFPRLNERNEVTRTAQKGVWKPGPGIALFERVARDMGLENVQLLPIIGEDLGVITPEVDALRNAIGAPGMGVLQFAPWGDLHYRKSEKEYVPLSMSLDPSWLAPPWENIFYNQDGEWLPFLDHMYLPHNAAKYGKRYFTTGSHDNETIAGAYTDTTKKTPEQIQWMDRARPVFQAYISQKSPETVMHMQAIDVVMQEPAVAECVFQMQDVLGLPNYDPITGAQIRTNWPNTTGQWGWKLGEGQFTPIIQKQLYEMTKRNGRI